MGDRTLWSVAILAGTLTNLLLFAVLGGLRSSENPPRSPRVLSLTLDFIQKEIHHPPAVVPQPRNPRPRPEKRKKRQAAPRPERPALRQVAEKREPMEREEKHPEPLIPPSNRPAHTAEQKQALPRPVPVYQLSGLPRFLHQEKPIYPPHLRRQGKEATVKLEIYIDASGKVREIKVLKSAGTEFDRAAIAAIHASTFVPGNVAGKPVPVLMRLPIRFKLR